MLTLDARFATAPAEPDTELLELGAQPGEPSAGRRRTAGSAQTVSRDPNHDRT